MYFRRTRLLSIKLNQNFGALGMPQLAAVLADQRMITGLWSYSRFIFSDRLWAVFSICIGTCVHVNEIHKKITILAPCVNG
jgi:hypothetical protein